MRTELKFICNFFSCLVRLISGEWILNSTRPNGGDIVIFRTLITSLSLFAIALFIQESVDPLKCWCFSMKSLTSAISEKFSTFGAIFAATYLALYARFSSQWTYLANVYNQIKAAETMANSNSDHLIAQWKAGFIEDALTLHLAHKRIFSSTIYAWGRDPLVAQAFADDCYGGKHDLELLLRAIKESRKKHGGSE